MKNALTEFYDKHAGSRGTPMAEAALPKVILTDISTFHPMPPDSPKGLPNMFPPMGSDDLGQESAFPTGSNPVDDYQTGFEAGKAQSDAVFSQSIAVMQDALDGLQKALEDTASQIEAEHGAILRQCLQALLPQLADHAVRREMEQIIQAALDGLIKGEIIAKFHPDNETASSFLEPISAEANTQNIPLTLRPCETLAEETISFEWSQGGADISPHHVAKTCLERLAQA